MAGVTVKKTLKGLRQNPAYYLAKDAKAKRDDTYCGSVVSGNLKNSLTGWMKKFCK